MAVIKIPAFPSGVARGVWANQLARSAVYAIESDAIAYDAGASANVFSIPEEFVVLGIGIEVTTAFTAGQGGFVNVHDTAGTVIQVFGEKQVEKAGFYEYPVLFRTAKTAGAGKRTRTLQVSVGAGGAAAGAFRVWLKFKPERGQGLTEKAVA